MTWPNSRKSYYIGCTYIIMALPMTHQGIDFSGVVLKFSILKYCNYVVVNGLTCVLLCPVVVFTTLVPSNYCF